MKKKIPLPIMEAYKRDVELLNKLETIYELIDSIKLPYEPAKDITTISFFTEEVERLKKISEALYFDAFRKAQIIYTNKLNK